MGALSGYTQLNFTEFGRFVVRSIGEVKKYNKIIMFPMQFDRLKINASTNGQVQNSWNESTREEMDRLCGSFDARAKKNYADQDLLGLTTTGGIDVLAIEFRLLECIPLVAKDGQDTIGETSASSFGAVTIQAVLANSKTGELVAVIEDALDLAPMTGLTRTTRSSQAAAWNKAFDIWLRNLRKDLIKLHNYSES